MYQARLSIYFSSVLIWTILGSLTFGFCSIWSLHFVAMLACELDLPIGIDVPLTILSSVLAVLFTFAALASDLLRERYRQGRQRRSRSRRSRRTTTGSIAGTISDMWNNSSLRLSESTEQDHGDYADHTEDSEHLSLLQGRPLEPDAGPPSRSSSGLESLSKWESPVIYGDPAQKSLALSPTALPAGILRPSSNISDSRRSSSFGGSTNSLHGLANIINIAQRSTAPARNAFIVTGEALYADCTCRNIVKGFLWSLAISGMHYVGIAALRIPNGYFTLNPFLVVLSGLISWAVCLVGVILISRIETHLAQQFLFSVVASTGVAAMHFTGMLVSFIGQDSQLKYLHRNGSRNVLVASPTL